MRTIHGAKLIPMVVLAAVSLVSCQIFPAPTRTSTIDSSGTQTPVESLVQATRLYETQLALTASVEEVQDLLLTQTQSAFETQAGINSATPNPPKTLYFPFVVISSPTLIPALPSPLAVWTSTPLVPTPPPQRPTTVCDRADILEEQPSGSLYAYVGQVLRKTWQISNVGACTWTPDYSLVFTIEGSQVTQVVPFSEYVRPGQSIELSTALAAPEQPGLYQGFTSLRNANGELLVLGPKGQKSEIMPLEVLPYSSGVIFDFAREYCSATWRSGSGYLSCIQVADPKDGLVGLLDYPVLESGLKFGPSLWMVPNRRPNGWISGEYPYIAIQPGDRLLAELGCLSDNPSCDILFQISYEIPGGSSGTLGEWRETYDGLTSLVNINLYFLAGSTVRFTLTTRVQNNQPQDAEAVWVYVRIER